MAKYSPVWSEFTACCIVLSYGVRFLRATYDVAVIPPTPMEPLVQRDPLYYFMEQSFGQAPQVNSLPNQFLRYYSVPRSFFIMSEHEWRTLTEAAFSEGHRLGTYKIIPSPTGRIKFEIDDLPPRHTLHTLPRGRG